MSSIAMGQDRAAVPMATASPSPPRRSMTSEGSLGSAMTSYTSSTPASGGARQPLNIAGSQSYRFPVCEFRDTSEPGVIHIVLPNGEIEEFRIGTSSEDTSSEDTASSEAGSNTSAELMSRFLATSEQEFLAMPGAMPEDSDVRSVASTKACSSTEPGLWTLSDDEEE
eukprot:TRINITY_DN13547_c0_g1_i4.p1 TRINITY_DN13547_c0_g1~~TRINITY_DN13547_c0_g1_i4.p1  ORF type:complete len:168 (+),score=14.76 TRINITY_DN13547_c0_g1_i4:67-570(+)